MPVKGSGPHERVAVNALGIDQQAIHIEDDGFDFAGEAHGVG